jgi:hypothetical protein
MIMGIDKPGRYIADHKINDGSFVPDVAQMIFKAVKCEQKGT